MKVGILETGAPPGDLAAAFGDYGAMFEHLLGETAFEWVHFNVQAGELPTAPNACEGYLITGSACGVYDPEPWIGRTEQFVTSAKGRAAMVGVCFGHQLLAQAFGGKVVKSPKGWGVGLHRYEVIERRSWMDEAPSISAAASHQDQVVEAPPNTTVLAASQFTPLGMLAYDDQPALSIQLHPEFEPAYAKALIELRRGGRYGHAQADAAIASLDEPDDRDRLGRWIGRFLARG